jgi:CBS domain-containing protein
MTTVADVMIRHPKTLAADASIDVTRLALADDRVHMVLLMNGYELVGTLVRDDLVGAGSGAGPALPWSTLVDRTVPPEADAGTVQRLLVERGLRRLAVVDPEGALLGLVCLKRHRTGFCSDADVAARAQDT